MFYLSDQYHEQLGRICAYTFVMYKLTTLTYLLTYLLIYNIRSVLK